MHSDGRDNWRLIDEAIREMDGGSPAEPIDISMEGPLQKIEWANENIFNFRSVIEEFLASNPFCIVDSINTRTGNKHFQIKYRKKFPLCASQYIGYAIYDLRSALEHVAVIAARKNGAKSDDVRYVSFPFASDRSNLKSILYKGSKSRAPLVDYVGHDFAQFIESERPYKTGNKLLWDFGRISIHDRHIEIVPVNPHMTTNMFGNIVANGGVDGRDRPGTAGFIVNSGNPQKGITISIGGPDATFSVGDSGSPDIGTNTDVLFEGTETFANESVYVTLVAASALVNEIVERAKVVLSKP